MQGKIQDNETHKTSKRESQDYRNESTDFDEEEPLLTEVDVLPSSQPSISTLGLISISFFWVSGGIYGDEALIGAAPPLVLVCLVCGGAFLNALPISLITAELATGWPIQGGMAAWVEVACGKTVGWFYRWCLCCCYAFDCVIYPVLASEYLQRYVSGGITFEQRKFYAMGIIGFVTFIKLTGRSWIVRFSSVIAALSILPALVYIGAGLPHLDVHKVFKSTGHIDVPLSISYTLWMFSGFFSLGSVAAEVSDPKRSYSITLAVLLPVVALLNCLQVVVSISLDDNRDNYAPGHFQQLAEIALGPAMKHIFFIGAQVSLVGLYNSTAITVECSIPAYFRPLWLSLGVPTQAPFHNRWLTAFLFDEQETGVGRFYILIVAFLGCFIVWLPFNFLIEFSMVLAVTNIIPFLFTFLRLRYSFPEVHRPFRVPGGMFVAVLVAFPPFALSVLFLLFAVILDDRKVYGLPHFDLIVFAGVMVVGVSVYWAKRAAGLIDYEPQM